jgi:outer membrane protein assembly factor BamB
MRTPSTLALALLLTPLAAAQAPPQSELGWPQWLGPFRDGRSAATSVFPATGPVRLRVAWKVPLGAGSAGLVVSGDRLVTLDADDKSVSAVALAPRDGSVAWRVTLDSGPQQEDSGPGSTPAIADGLVFALSPACQLRALELASGKAVWQVDLKAQFGAKLQRGCVSSPLVDGGHLVIQTGAPDDKRIVALDRKTGALAWVAKGIARASYSAPGLRGSGASREILIHHTDNSQGGEPRSALGALRAEDGQLVWQHTLDRAWSFATPVPVGDDGVLLLTWNDAALVKAPSGAQPAAVAWRNPGFTAYVAAPVYRDGYLYGHGGDYLRCLRASDGNTAWQERTYPGSVALVDGNLVTLSIAAGLMRVVEATPEAYRERARLQVAEPGSHVETPPSIAGRRIYVRNEDAVVAVDVEG